MNSIKKTQGEQSEYLGQLMRHLIDVRADGTFTRTLAEFMAPKLAPFVEDPALLVVLQEMRRSYEQNREELISAMPPMKRSHSSFSELTDTGKHEAITESQLKLTMAIDRVRELEEERDRREAEAEKAERAMEKAHAAELAVVQKQLDGRDATRKFWFKSIVTAVGIVVAGVVTWQITTTLATREKTTTTEIKEKLR